MNNKVILKIGLSSYELTAENEAEVKAEMLSKFKPEDVITEVVNGVEVNKIRLDYFWNN